MFETTNQSFFHGLIPLNPFIVWWYPKHHSVAYEKSEPNRGNKKIQQRLPSASNKMFHLLSNKQILGEKVEYVTNRIT